MSGWIWLAFGGCGLGPATVEEEALCELPEPMVQGPDGAELFARTWLPLDPRAPGGDGLGPMYNASSCASCHNQGGPGGAGGNHANVSSAPPPAVPSPVPIIKSTSGFFARARPGVRSTPALFGASAIDAVPEGELLVAEALGVDGHPEITGRVARDLEGRVTRFGWKGQTATLAGFVENACANELGLETAAVRQPGPEAPGLDIDDAMLAALVGYVASLPPPVELPTPGIERGRALFAEVGCAGCHRERLGEIDGLYSDLLLHDMGDALADSFSGYGIRPPPSFAGGAEHLEWRTPPLWGLRDSAPYLHDGRARTLSEAISLHGGEAKRISRTYARLPAGDREAIEQFLLSLAAPIGT